MTDLSKSSIERIQSHRLPDLDLGPASLHPHYAGLSILNLPASVCNWLGAPALHHPPLDLPELDSLAEGVEQVVVTLVDALAFHRFKRWVEGSMGPLRPWVRDGLLGALTSVVPSTTSTALTTLWTGRSPAEHGILGYELLLKELGVVANMITHAPACFQGQAGALYSAGFDPEGFLPVPTLGPHLTEAGIEPYVFIHHRISSSGLTRMIHPAAQVHTYAMAPDLWIGVRELAARPPDGRRYIYVYYGGLDGLSHIYGPDSEQTQAGFGAFARAMVEGFLSRHEEPGGGTLFLLLADHGQIATPSDPAFDLRNHADLSRRLHLKPTGENRLPYFHVHPGQQEAVRSYLEGAWPSGFRVSHADHALEAGLFGPGTPARQARGRLGELIAVAQGRAYLWWAAEKNPLQGRHGGLSEQEMLVPLLALRLG